MLSLNYREETEVNKEHWHIPEQTKELLAREGVLMTTRVHLDGRATRCEHRNEIESESYCLAEANNMRHTHVEVDSRCPLISLKGLRLSSL